MDYFQKYIKYKTKYLQLNNLLGGSIKNNLGALNYDEYDLIGIGDFTHGINDIWSYRIDLIKNILITNNKPIIIFHEILPWHAKNIMFDKKIKISGPYIDRFNHPLNRYGWRVYDSPIYLEFINLVRKNLDRIKIIGIDTEILRRDKIMVNKILKNLDTDNINLFFAHNGHIDDRRITEKYEDPNEKYRCGHYLRKKLGNRYCIILSCGFIGSVRFGEYCHDETCDQMDIYPIPVSKSFEFPDLKSKYEKYDKYTLIHNRKNLYIYEFSRASITYKNLPMKYTTPNANYLLLLNDVSSLNLINIINQK